VRLKCQVGAAPQIIHYDFMNESEILNLEQQLLLEKVRSSANRVAELLADGCVEYCSSGKIWRFWRGRANLGLPLAWLTGPEGALGLGLRNEMG
jgi:hypothetical protein